MGIWKFLFGAGGEPPEEAAQRDEARRFDLLKYDGVKALRLNQPDYAVKCLREALKIDGDDVEAHDLLSQALIRLGRFDEALDELDVLSQARPSLPLVYARMGHVAFMMEDYDRLATIATQAMEAVADDWHALYMMAQARIGQGRDAEAVEWLTKAVERDDAQEAPRLLRAQTLLRTGMPGRAADDARWLADHAADEEEVQLLLARLAAMQGHADEALVHYAAVIELNPFSIDAYTERLRLRMEQGDREGAEDDLKRVQELQPEGPVGEAESVEQMMKRASTPINPFGL